ncbi:syntaxin 6, N-terminal-domain-containing protein, partial [Umbelopsis sp. PMI_123]
LNSEVEGSLDNATALFDSWKRIYNTVSSPSNEELMWTADELSSALEAISQDLDDLQESIAAVEKRPDAFNLTSSEVQARNNFITRTRNAVREMIMMQEQDTQLDSISGTLHNLKDIAGTMHQEVEDHVVLLDELDQHVDTSSNRLGRAMSRVKYILRKEE